jgi:choline/glycine/proline betaine transport protein
VLPGSNPNLDADAGAARTPTPPARSPYDHPTDWMSAWTLFFWAWWIAWASFVGLFLARISRGRTIREFVVGTMIIPFTYVLMWVSIFGNSAIDIVRSGDKDFGRIATSQPEHGFYTLLTHYPAFGLIASVATFVGLLFYVTSADSGALVMGNLCSTLRTPQDDATPSIRIFWALATGLLTVAMLIVGGVPALQNATIIMGHRQRMVAESLRRIAAAVANFRSR